MDVDLKYLPLDITDPEELKKQHDMFTVLKWKNVPNETGMCIHGNSPPTHE